METLKRKERPRHKSVFETRTFRKQHRAWMRRLLREGFIDIERTDRKGTVAQDLSERIHFKDVTVESTQNYYSWAISVTHTRRFKNSRFMRRSSRKKIWRLHAVGQNNSEIGRVVGLSRWTIEDMVNQIRSHLGKK